MNEWTNESEWTSNDEQMNDRVNKLVDEWTSERMNKRMKSLCKYKIK